ncbi:DUF1617 family protein [Lactiplantibacillus herbarum]|uniref:DUF1617 family protein n=1 Tax=Lactiplantibacillus herbarum TaxID=1670446 RepID=UPI00069D61B4|nr:DUF1617 family protein [Lactiplantibacillus herbarum]
MKFTIENQYLNGAVTLMQRIPLTGYQSMARTRFIRVLNEPVQAMVDAQKDLLEQYAVKGDDGEPISDNGNYTLQKDTVQEYKDAYDKLIHQSAEIDKGTYTDHKRDIQEVLKNCKLELSGDDASVYAALCDALEVSFEKEGK